MEINAGVVILLQGIFPGLWLTSVTPDMYRVPDAPLKVLCSVLF